MKNDNKFITFTALEIWARQRGFQGLQTMRELAESATVQSAEVTLGMGGVWLKKRGHGRFKGSLLHLLKVSDQLLGRQAPQGANQLEPKPGQTGSRT